MRKRGLQIVTALSGWLCLVVVAPITDSTRVHYIHWNASNPRFQSSSEGGEYVVDVDLGDEPWQYHQAWLPDGDSHIFRSYVFGPSVLKDYGSATLRCKI